MNISKSVYYYKSIKDDSPVIEKLIELTRKHTKRGCDKLYDQIRQEGLIWNYKRVRRVYVALKLNLKRQVKKRLPARVKQPIIIPDSINGCWSMDFMSDALCNGRKIRILNILDDYNREILAIETSTSIPSVSVVRTLEEIISWRGKPQKIRVDNGPEFTSLIFADWCKENGIEIQYIQPGKPVQNALIERFNRTFRGEVLDAYIFEDLNQVRGIAQEWMEDYNEERPHESLGSLSPNKFKALALLVDSGKLEKSFPQSTRNYNSNN